MCYPQRAKDDAVICIRDNDVIDAEFVEIPYSSHVYIRAGVLKEGKKNGLWLNDLV